MSVCTAGHSGFPGITAGKEYIIIACTDAEGIGNQYRVFNAYDFSKMNLAAANC